MRRSSTVISDRRDLEGSSTGSSSLSAVLPHSGDLCLLRKVLERITDASWQCRDTTHSAAEMHVNMHITLLNDGVVRFDDVFFHHRFLVEVALHLVDELLLLVLGQDNNNGLGHADVLL